VKKLLMFLAVFTMCLAMTGVASANLVVNGNFATGDTTGWTFVPAAVGSDFYVGTPGALSTYAAYFGAVDIGNYDSLSQVLTTVPGQMYTVSFYLTHLDTDSQSDFYVQWDGTTLFDFLNGPSFPYTQYSTTVSGTGSDTLLFAGYEVPSWFGLSDVDVEAVPIPGAVWLVVSGLVGLLGLRKSRKG